MKGTVRQIAGKGKPPIRLQSLHHLSRRAHSLIDVVAAVSGRKEARLELRRGKIYARVQHAVKESREARAVAMHRVGKVVHGPACEVAAEHRAAAIKGHGHA